MARIYLKFISFLIIISLPSSPFSLSAGAASKDNRQRIASSQNSLNYKPGEVLVKFKSKASVKQRQLINKRSGAEKTLRSLSLGKDKISLVKLDEGVSVKKAVEEFESEGLVEYAEPNYLRRTTALTPYDSFFSNQWGLDNTGQEIEGIIGANDADMDVKEAWLIEKGATNPVTVAVIDSGIDFDHEDLKNKITDNGYNWAGISQYNWTGGWALGSAAEDTRGFAQSITGTGQQLTHLGLFLGKYGSPTKDISVSIREGSIDGNVIASYSIAPGEINGYGAEIYKELSPQPILTKDTTYFIRISADDNGSYTNNYYEIYDNSTENDEYDFYVDNPYAEGEEWWWDGYEWVQVPIDDLYFHTNPNSSPHDDWGHGTHVSGIIAAEINNNKGIAGVSAGAKIMPLKASDSSGSLYSEDIISAITYAADNNADIINMSFGSASPSTFEQAAVNYAYGQGAVLFASAGNDYDSTPNYPAGYENVIGVGATTNEDEKADFSNFNETVDISAPGLDIYSTMPSYQVGINNDPWGDYTKDYSYMSGTSMASPMAAGVAALLLSQNPGYSAANIQQILQNTANDKGAAGYDNDFGYGQANAFKALGGTDETTPLPEDLWPEPPLEEEPPQQQPPSQQIQPATNTGSNTQVTNPPKTILSTILSLIKPKAVKKGKLVTVKGQLKDNSGKPLTGKKVVIKKKVLKKIRKKVKGKIKTIKKWVWQKIATVKTDAKGNFSKKLKPKETITLKAEYAGDAGYSSSSKSTKINIKKG